MVSVHVQKIKSFDSLEPLRFYLFDNFIPTEDCFHNNKDLCYTIIQRLIDDQAYELAKTIAIEIYDRYQHNRLIYYIAYSLYQLGRYSEALFDWLKLINYQKMNLRERHLKALIYDQLNQPYQAIRILESLGKNYSKTNKIQYLLGKLYYQIGEFNKSLDCYLRHYENNQEIWPEIFIKFAQEQDQRLEKIVKSLHIDTNSKIVELYAYSLFLYFNKDFVQARHFSEIIIRKQSDHWESYIILIKIYGGLSLRSLFNDTIEKLWPIMPIVRSEIFEILDTIYDMNYWSQELSRYLIDLYLMHDDQYVSITALQWYIRLKSNIGLSKQLLIELENLPDHTLQSYYISHLYADLYAELNYPFDLVVSKYIEAIESRVNDPNILRRLVAYCMEKDQIKLALDYIKKYELSIYWHRDFIKIKERYGIINNE